MATGMDGPTNAKLLKILECPICFESPMIQPVYQCETGHSICSRCKTKLNKCGVCQKKFTGTRNYAIEQIAESIKFKFYCKNKDQGCATVTTRGGLTFHEIDCSYRPVICNDNRKTPCKNNPVKVRDFLSHLKNIHECTGNESKGGFFTSTNESALNINPGIGFETGYYVKFNEKYFVHQTHVDQNNVHWWVYLIGTPEEAKHYQYELTIRPGPRRFQNAKMKYKLPVRSMYDKFKEIARAGLLATYPKTSLVPLSEIEGSSPVCKWNMKLKIIRVEEAEDSDEDSSDDDY